MFEFARGPCLLESGLAGVGEALGFHGGALDVGEHEASGHPPLLDALLGNTVLFFLLQGVAETIPGHVQQGPVPCGQTPSLGLQRAKQRPPGCCWVCESIPQVPTQGRVTLGILFSSLLINCFLFFFFSFRKT